MNSADSTIHCNLSFTAREPVRMLAGAQATTRYAGVR